MPLKELNLLAVVGIPEVEGSAALRQIKVNRLLGVAFRAVEIDLQPVGLKAIIS